MRWRRRDEAAQEIADEGQEWARKVVRKKDTEIYVWRLLLEWRRSADHRKAELRFVVDSRGEWCQFLRFGGPVSGICCRFLAFGIWRKGWRVAKQKYRQRDPLYQNTSRSGYMPEDLGKLAKRANGWESPCLLRVIQEDDEQDDIREKQVSGCCRFA